MLITIHNLPSNARYGDIKSLINAKCNLRDVILDNLVAEGTSKKVTVGVSSEEDASVIFRNLDGFYVQNNQLRIETVNKVKPANQQYSSSSSMNVRPQSNQYEGMGQTSSGMGQAGGMQELYKSRMAFMPPVMSAPPPPPMDNFNKNTPVMGYSYNTPQTPITGYGMTQPYANNNMVPQLISYPMQQNYVYGNNKMGTPQNSQSWGGNNAGTHNNQGPSGYNSYSNSHQPFYSNSQQSSYSNNHKSQFDRDQTSSGPQSNDRESRMPYKRDHESDRKRKRSESPRGRSYSRQGGSGWSDKGQNASGYDDSRHRSQEPYYKRESGHNRNRYDEIDDNSNRNNDMRSNRQGSSNWRGNSQGNSWSNAGRSTNSRRETYNAEYSEVTSTPKKGRWGGRYSPINDYPSEPLGFTDINAPEMSNYRASLNRRGTRSPLRKEKKIDQGTNKPKLNRTQLPSNEILNSDNSLRRQASNKLAKKIMNNIRIEPHVSNAKMLRNLAIVVRARLVILTNAVCGLTFGDCIKAYRQKFSEKDDQHLYNVLAQRHKQVKLKKKESKLRSLQKGKGKEKKKQTSTSVKPEAVTVAPSVKPEAVTVAPESSVQENVQNSQPAPTKSGSTQHVPVQPASAQQGSTQQLPIQQVTNQQGPDQPISVQPNLGQQDLAEPVLAQQLPAQQDPAQSVSVQPGLAQQLPVQEVPNQQGPAQQVPIQQGPAQQGPSQTVPEQQAPAKGKKSKNKMDPSISQLTMPSLEGLANPTSNKLLLKANKRQARQEFLDGPEAISGDPIVKAAVQMEIDDIEKLMEDFLEENEKTATEIEKTFFERYKRINLSGQIIHVLQLHVLRRSLNTGVMPLIRINGKPKLPRKGALSDFLHGRGVMSLNKSERKPFFIATCATYRVFDSLIQLDSAFVDGSTITFRPMNLTNPLSRKMKESIIIPHKPSNDMDFTKNDELGGFDFGQAAEYSDDGLHIDESVEYKTEDTENISQTEDSKADESRNVEVVSKNEISEVEGSTETPIITDNANPISDKVEDSIDDKEKSETLEIKEAQNEEANADTVKVEVASDQVIEIKDDNCPQAAETIECTVGRSHDLDIGVVNDDDLEDY